MKLEFRLLIVDDEPSGIREAISILEDHLKNNGFSMVPRFVEDFSDQGLRDLARLEGKNYDLVMVDYNLGQTDTNGAAAALRLRREMQYTDMVFYSSDRTLNLYSKLADHEVSGVFITRRDDLDTALTGLTDTVIGKAVDLNHMRGIAMAEVAEMDVLMEETLGRAFQSPGGYFATAAGKVTRRLLDGTKKTQEQLEQRLNKVGLADIVRDSRLFSSTHKYMAIRGVAKSLSDKPIEALNVLDSYQDDILNNRNMLAHAKEFDEDGKTILRSIRRNGGMVTIDDDWMTGFRQKLTRHRDALTIVCKAIVSQIDAAEAPHESK